MAAEQAPQRTYEERMIAGRIDRENETGIRIVQADGSAAWADWGRYYKGQRAGVGADIEALVKGKFITALKVLGGAETEDLTGDDFASLTPPAPDGDEPNESWGHQGPSRYPQGEGVYPKGTAAPRRVAPAPAARPPAQPQPAPTNPTKSREWLRATAVQAAATLLAGRADTSAEDVGTTADHLFAWITDGEGKGEG